MTSEVDQDPNDQSAHKPSLWARSKGKTGCFSHDAQSDCAGIKTDVMVE